MRRLAAIAALWSCYAWAQAAEGVSIIQGESDLDSVFLSADAGVDPPLFSFASPSPFRGGYSAYQGLPATDGCYAAAAVTGTKGEALTFTRATTRFCPTSANEATGVMCASGEVCITSSGTTRGISIFRAGTNLVLRSEEFDNAAWVNNVDAAPRNTTVTANAATAPIVAASTADQLDLIATTGSQLSTRAQVNPCGGSVGVNSSYGVWVKGVSGSGTVDLCFDTSCVACAFTSTAWALCKAENIADTNITQVTVGNNSAQNGGTARPTQSIYVWGNHCFNAAYLSPYVATTSAAATRNREDATFPVASATPACVGATWGSPARFAATRNRALGVLKAPSGTNIYDWYTPSDATTGVGICDWYIGGASNTGATSNSMTAGNVMRLSCEYNGTNLTAGLDGTYNNTARSFTPWTQSATYYVGNYSSEGGYHADGLLSNIVIDTSTTRCR